MILPLIVVALSSRAAAPTTHAAPPHPTRLTQSPPQLPPPQVHNHIAYLPSPPATAIERWDLTATPPLRLPPFPSRDRIAHVAVGPGGVFAVLADRPRIMYWPLSGGPAVPIVELAGPHVGTVQALGVLTDHLVVAVGSGVHTFDARSGDTIDSAAAADEYLSTAAVAPGARSVFAVATSTTDGRSGRLVRYDIAADGTIGPPRYGPPGGWTGYDVRLSASADGAQLLDSHGTRYDGASLAPSGSIGLRPEAVALDGDTLYAVFHQQLWRWAGAWSGGATGGGPIPSRGPLDDRPFGLAVDNGGVFTFARVGDDLWNDPQNSRLMVQRIDPNALQLLSAVPADPTEPDAAPFAPDLVAVGADGNLVIGSVARNAVFRWSVAERRWLNGFALGIHVDDSGNAWSPTELAYDVKNDRVFAPYADGGIDVLALSGPAAGIARPFAFDSSRWTAPVGPVGLVAADGWLVLSGVASRHPDIPTVFAPDGRPAGNLPIYDQEPPLVAGAWDAAHRRLVRISALGSLSNPRALHVFPWDTATGPVTATVASAGRDLDLDAPLFIAPDGDTVLTATGLLFSGAGLTALDTLSSPVTAAAWIAGRLVTSRSSLGHSELVLWGADRRPVAVTPIGGSVAALVARGDSVLAVSALNGDTVMSEWRVASSLTPVWSAAPPPPPNDAPETAIPFQRTFDAIGLAAVDTNGASRAPGEPIASCGDDRQAPVWFRFDTSTLSGSPVIDTAGSTFDTTLSMWRKDGADTWVEEACATDGLGDGAARLAPPDVEYGVHWLAVSGAGAATGRLVVSLASPLDTRTEPSLVAEDAAGLWFARTEPPRLERWDFAAADWRPPTPLPARVSSLAVGTGGLWLAADRRLLWLPNGTSVVQTRHAFDTSITDIAPLEGAAAGMLAVAGTTLWRLNAAGQVVGWRRIPDGRQTGKVTIQTVDAVRAEAWLEEPEVMRRWPLLADGRIAATPAGLARQGGDRSRGMQPSDRIHRPIGARRFLVADRTVADATDLQSRYTLEAPPDYAELFPFNGFSGVHHAVAVDGTWVGANGSTLSAWDGAGTLSGWFGLPWPAVHVTRRGDTLVAALDYASEYGTPRRNPAVLAVPLDRLGPLSRAVPSDPGATLWSPGLVAAGGGTAYLGASDLLAVRRWSVSDRRWLSAIQLPDTPIALAADDQRVWVWLVDGTLLTGSADADTLSDVGRLTQRSCGLVAVAGRAFVCEQALLAPDVDFPWSSDHWGPKQWSIRAADGRAVSRSEPPASLAEASSSSNWAWHAASSRLVAAADGRLLALPVSVDGELGELVTDSLGADVAVGTRVWVDPRTDAGLTNAGVRFRPSDLRQTGTLNVQPIAAGWRGGRLWLALSGGGEPSDPTDLEIRRGDGRLEHVGQLIGFVTDLVPTASGMLAIGAADRPSGDVPAGFPSFPPNRALLLAELDDAAAIPLRYQLPVAPANDRPAAAVALQFGRTEPAAVDNTPATDADDGPPPSCAPDAHRGIWYWIDAYGVHATLDLTGTDHAAVVTSYPLVNGSPGPEEACVAGSATLPVSTVIEPGMSGRHLIRISGVGDAHGQIRLRTGPAVPRNDTREQATVIASLPLTTTASLRGAARETDRDPGCVGSDAVDVWWRFTAPAPGRFEAAVTSQSSSSVGLAAWLGPDAEERIGCRNAWDSGGAALRFDLDAGDTIWLQALDSGASGPVVVTLRALPPTPPAAPGDNWRTAIDVTTLPFEVQAAPGLATTEPDEVRPLCGTYFGDFGSLWWRFEATRPTKLRAFVTDSRSPTVVSLWRGTAHPLELMGCTDGQESPEFRGPRVDLAAGETVWIRFDGHRGQSDRPTLRLVEATLPANDDLADAREAAPLPFQGSSAIAEAGVEAGERDCDLVDGSDTADASDHTVWWRFTPETSGRVRVTSLTEGLYHRLSAWSGRAHPLKPLTCVEADNVGGRSGIEVSASVEIEVRAGVPYTIQVGTSGDLPQMDDRASVVIEPVPPLANDDLAGASDVAPFAAALAVDTRRTTNEQGERIPSCSPTAGRSVWWRITSPVSQAVQIAVSEADFDTVLSAWKGTRHPLDELACHDDASSDDTRAALTLFLEPTVPVWVKLEGFADSGGMATVRFGVSDVRPRLWLPWAGVGEGRAEDGPAW